MGISNLPKGYPFNADVQCQKSALGGGWINGRSDQKTSNKKGTRQEFESCLEPLHFTLHIDSVFYLIHHLGLATHIKLCNMNI